MGGARRDDASLHVSGAPTARRAVGLMGTRVVTAACSDVGPVRHDNQDSGYAGAHLAVVADGVGGHAAGALASSLVVGVLAGFDGEAWGEQAQERLERAVADAQGVLLRRAEDDPATRGMGTTLTALLDAGDHLVLAHIGDSRCYRLRAGSLVQVSHDDTFVQQLVDEGHITADQAAAHPMRHAITASLGDAGASTRARTSVHDAVPGDRWLLCSDGLTGAVSDEAIAAVLGAAPAADACAARLVDLALRAGTSDNTTCVVLDVVSDDDRDARALDVRPQVVGAAAADRTG